VKETSLNTSSILLKMSGIANDSFDSLGRGHHSALTSPTVSYYPYKYRYTTDPMLTLHVVVVKIRHRDGGLKRSSKSCVPNK
jgi:hypothetical protein